MSVMALKTYKEAILAKMLKRKPAWKGLESRANWVNKMEA